MAKTEKKKTKKQKQPATIIEKKKLKRKKLKKTLALLSSSDSDSDSSLSGSDKLQSLLEPYSKDQLINFLVDAAFSHPSLLHRLRSAADSDVSHRKVFVHGLGWDSSRETLVSSFGGFGEIEECNVITDRATGKSKGYGFVLFKTRKGAKKALKEPRKMIGTRMASCQLASLGPVASASGGATKAVAGGAEMKDGLTRKIYVSNVPPEADPEKLRALFAKFGDIEAGPIGYDMRTGKSRGFALFVYKTQESARKALHEQYKMFDGHQLRCQKAAEGKNKGAGMGAASITTAMQPVQAPVLAAMAAAQSMAMMNQQYQYQYPSLNPLYSGLMNPMMAAQGFVGTGQVGEYGASGSSQVGNLGGGLGSLVLETYGKTGSVQAGLQQAYPSSQLVQTSSAKPLGATASGSYTGYRNPSFK